jgi:hypothetical protein
MSDLVERVARVLVSPKADPSDWRFWTDEARAAIAVVLEEAAKVAENASFHFTQTTPSTVEVVDVRHTIAAAIRALVKNG